MLPITSATAVHTPMAGTMRGAGDCAVTARIVLQKGKRLRPLRAASLRAAEQPRGGGTSEYCKAPAARATDGRAVRNEQSPTQSVLCQNRRVVSILRHERQIVRRFQEAGAVSPATAQRL